MEHFRLGELKPRSTTERAPEDAMALALPFDGVAPLLLHVVFHPFELGHTAVERKVLVESFELRGKVPLLIAPSPMAVLLQPGVGAVHEFPTACLGRHADDRACALRIDPADVFEAQKLEGTGLPAIGGRALAGKPPKEHHPGLVRRQFQSKLLHAAGERAVEVLGVALVLKRDNEIVHKARQIGFALHVFLGSLLKPEVEHVVQIDIGEAGRNYTPYKVANLVLEYSTSIPRTQLRPGDGDGFRGAPLHVVSSRHSPTSQEQGDRHGTSSQHTAPDSGGSSPI